MRPCCLYSHLLLGVQVGKEWKLGTGILLMCILVGYGLQKFPLRLEIWYLRTGQGLMKEFT